MKGMVKGLKLCLLTTQHSSQLQPCCFPQMSYQRRYEVCLLRTRNVNPVLPGEETGKKDRHPSPHLIPHRPRAEILLTGLGDGQNAKDTGSGGESTHTLDTLFPMAK